VAQAATALTTAVQKYLTFTLADETYGLDILRVQEIIGMMPVTRVPQTPEFVRGVINLRGRVIPVVDLRSKFGTEAVDTERTCIVVVQVSGKTSSTMGVVVDEVSEVADIADGQIESTPDFGAGIETDFVRGVGKVADRVVMLLDIDRVLSASDIRILKRVASSQASDGEETEGGEGV
jgi:purine-binding chemotaxis protein CheW